MDQVTMGDLCDARARGEINPEQWRGAVEVLAGSPPRHTWARFLDRACLVIGTGLVLAGVIYVVAWNWSGLGYMTKLCMAGGLVVAAGAAGVWLGGQRLSGRLAMASAGVLVGPMLVVYSQAYQIGANPWVLFAAWAACMTPFALAARLSGFWLFWIAVLDVAVLTRVSQSADNDLAGICAALLLLGVVHGVVVGVWEGRSEGRVFGRVVAAAGLTFTLYPALQTLMDAKSIAGVGLLSAVVLLVAVAVIQVVYWRRGRDLFMVAASGAALIVLVTTWLARTLNDLGASWLVWSLALGVVLVIQSLGMVLWVRLAQARTPVEAP